MSMLDCPLVIKTKITEENFVLLIKELSLKYRTSWIRKCIRFDGTYLYVDEITSEFGRYHCLDDVIQILRRCVPTNEQVGIIFSGNWSYQVADLYFVDGKIVTTNPIVIEDCDSYTKAMINEIIENNRRIYLERKNQFMPDFPKSSPCVNSLLSCCREERWKSNKITVPYEIFQQAIDNIVVHEQYTILHDKNDFIKDIDYIDVVMPNIVYTDGVHQYNINDINNPILLKICENFGISPMAVYYKNAYDGLYYKYCDVEIYFNK